MSADQDHCLGWIARFHAGDRGTIEQCYREYFALVMAAVGGPVQGADRETIVHDVFFELLKCGKTRSRFKGGNFASWLRSIARNKAIDYARRRGRETSVEPNVVAELAANTVQSCECYVQLAEFLNRFLQQHVPRRLVPLFKARFIDQRTQRRTAEILGVPRTTVVYHETRLRRQLRRFVLRAEGWQ